MVGIPLFRGVRYFEHIRYFGVIVDLSQEISFTGVFLTIDAKFEFFTTCGTRIRWVPNTLVLPSSRKMPGPYGSDFCIRVDFH